MTDVLNSVNPQQKPNINELKFDVLKIDSRIKKDSQFEEDGTIFQFCPEYHPESIDESDQKSDYVKYIAKIKNPSFQYLGILSKNLKKENYGYNIFDNGDEYFGQWNKDKKEGYGIYYFSDPECIKQIYVGEFKNAQRKLKEDKIKKNLAERRRIVSVMSGIEPIRKPPVLTDNLLISTTSSKSSKFKNLNQNNIETGGGKSNMLQAINNASQKFNKKKQLYEQNFKF